MWWPASKNNLPDVFVDLFKEITDYSDRALAVVSRSFDDPKPGDHVLPEFLPVFMQKLVAVKRRVGKELEAAAEKKDIDRVNELALKRDFLQEMLSIYICSRPRPPELKWNFHWQICRDFRIAIRPTTTVPVTRDDAPPRKIPVIVDSDNDDDPEPLVPPKIDPKKLH